MHDSPECFGAQNFVHFREGTVLMALLQPAPETYELFDDIMLMADGFIVFHGAKDEVSGALKPSSQSSGLRA